MLRIPVWLMAGAFVLIAGAAIEGAYRAGHPEILRLVATGLLILCVVFMVKR